MRAQMYMTPDREARPAEYWREKIRPTPLAGHLLPLAAALLAVALL